MRVRTEEKRREIVRVASDLFHDNGYERTSMSMISEALGGSKATLYGYFSSKEQLLAATLVYDVTEEADRLMNEFLAEEDLRGGLIKLGVAYLMRRLSSGPIANVRMFDTGFERLGKAVVVNCIRCREDRRCRCFDIVIRRRLFRGVTTGDEQSGKERGDKLHLDPWASDS